MSRPSETETGIITQIDKLTKQQSVMQTDHTYIHAGISFVIAFDLGSISAAIHVSFLTSATGFIHFRPGNVVVTSDADAVEYILREGITSSTGGASYTPFNRNRNHDGVSSVTVTTGVTPTLGTPTLLDIFFIGTAGNPASRSGGTGGSGEEIILKPSTEYLFTFTPAGATNVSFTSFWYEEDVT